MRLEPRWGVYEDVLCVGKEDSFAFVERVLDAVRYCGGRGISGGSIGRLLAPFAGNWLLAALDLCFGM